MEQQDRIMDGDLQTLGLQSILKMLALSGKTGKLFVHSGPETLSISLDKGQIVALHEEGVVQPDILSMLCLVHKLDPPRAQMIRELAQGDMHVALMMLVERGWMSRAEMQQRLEFVVTQSISHALRWSNGRFAFHRHMVPIGGQLKRLDVDSVLLEALRQADEWEEIAKEGVTHLTRMTVTRWLPEVSKDVRSLSLSQDSLHVLYLSNGEVPLQSVALVLMMPEARVARLMAQLLDLRLIEIVNTALETELQQDLANIIIRCQHALASQKKGTTPEQHLLNLINTFSECVNGLLFHHGRYARVMRGRGQVQAIEIARYLERRFAQPLQMLAKQQFSILETASFVNGRLDCSDILTLNKVVRGEQLEEFYWEAVQGLASYLRIVFDGLLHDEVGNSHTGRHLNMAWKVFLTEIDREMEQYQLYRAHRNAQQARGREPTQAPALGFVQKNPQSRNGGMGTTDGYPRTTESHRRTL